MNDRCSLCGRKQVRSTAQNRLLWALLTEISERLKVDGHSFTPEVWNEYMAKKFLGAEEHRLPNGELMVVRRSTSDLPEDAFSDYLNRVEEWARDRNVWLQERETT
jgi:hypothetical protein